MGEREEGEEEKECLERRGVISGHDVIKPVTVKRKMKTFIRGQDTDGFT